MRVAEVNKDQLLPLMLHLVQHWAGRASKGKEESRPVDLAHRLLPCCSNKQPAIVLSINTVHVLVAGCRAGASPQRAIHV